MEDYKNTMEIIPSEQTVTLVTMFFDIPRREQNKIRMQTSEYLKYGKYVLSLDVPMVIYTDPEFVDFMKEQREPFQEKTKIVPITMEELPHYKYLDRITECKKLNPVLNSGTTKDTPLYLISNWSKFTFLEWTAKENPFQATHIGWIDFGLAHVVIPPFDPFDQVFTKFDDAIRMELVQMYDSEMIEKNLKQYLTYLWSNVASGYMTGSVQNMLDFSIEFEKLAINLLEKGHASSEEMIIPILCSQCPEKFSFYCGIYKDILLNYRKQRGIDSCIIRHLAKCRECHRHDLGVLAGKEVVRSFHAGILRGSKEIFLSILDAYYVSAYYHYAPDQTEALNIAKLYIKLISTNEDYEKEFLKIESHIRSNFSYLKEPVFLEYDNSKQKIDHK